MLLPCKRKLHNRRKETMNIDNRRLREVQLELKAYHELLENADTISDSLIYQGKIEALEKEEANILARYDVIT